MAVSCRRPTARRGENPSICRAEKKGPFERAKSPVSSWPPGREAMVGRLLCAAGTGMLYDFAAISPSYRVQASARTGPAISSQRMIGRDLPVSHAVPLFPWDNAFHSSRAAMGQKRTFNADCRWSAKGQQATSIRARPRPTATHFRCHSFGRSRLHKQVADAKNEILHLFALDPPPRHTSTRNRDQPSTYLRVALHRSS